MNYFTGKGFEEYLLVQNKKSPDQDPLFNLVGIADEFDFAKTLKWKNAKCAN